MPTADFDVDAVMAAFTGDEPGGAPQDDAPQHQTDQVDDGQPDSEGAGGGEDRLYTRQELEAETARAKASVQSAKDREIEGLKGQLGLKHSDETIAQWEAEEPEDPDQATAYWKAKATMPVRQAASRSATERAIRGRLADVAAEAGVSIDTADPRLDLRTPATFERSLTKIVAEELRKAPGERGKAPAAKPAKNPDEDRFEGGQSQGGPVIDLKQFEGTGELGAALFAMRRMGKR